MGRTEGKRNLNSVGRAPAGVNPPEFGARFDVTPAQELAEGCRKPAIGCLVIVCAVGMGIVLKALAEIPEVARFIQAHFGN